MQGNSLEFLFSIKGCNPVSALLKHVSINPRCGNVLVPQQSLNGSNIRSSLQKVGCKTVAKTMRGDLLLKP